MSFLRHGEIYRFDMEPMTGSGNRCRRSQPLIGVDESPVGYSLVGCSPAEPTSASPTANHIQSLTPPYNDFSSNGAYPLNFVSQPKGALQETFLSPRLGRDLFLAELRERFAQFGLQLHADKTRIVEFGRYAENNRRNRGDGTSETFNFLGFTHSCGKTRKGYFTVLRQTMRQRWQAKLRDLKGELRRRMHTPIREQGAYLRSVLQGHFRYYGVPMNGPALCAFRQAVGYLWRTVLRRRSQSNHLQWRRVLRYIKRWFPPARVCHPYPLVRLGVLTLGGSRMR